MSPLMLSWWGWITCWSLKGLPDPRKDSSRLASSAAVSQVVAGSATPMENAIEHADYRAKLMQIRQIYHAELDKYEQVGETGFILFIIMIKFCILVKRISGQFVLHNMVNRLPTGQKAWQRVCQEHKGYPKDLSDRTSKWLATLLSKNLKRVLLTSVKNSARVHNALTYLTHFQCKYSVLEE